MVDYYKEDGQVFASVQIDVNAEIKLLDNRIAQFQAEIDALNAQKAKLLAI